MPYTVDQSFPPFQKSIKRLHKKVRTLSSDLYVLFLALAANPALGALVSGHQSLLPEGDGLFKIRVQVVGMGKSAGPRLLYLVVTEERIIFPLFLYRHQDLSTVDIPDAEVRALIEDFRSFLEDAGR